MSGALTRTLLLDLGSSAIKARVIGWSADADSYTIAELSTPMPSADVSTLPSRHETDPVAVVDAVRALVNRILAEAGCRVNKMGVSSQMHSVLVTDAHGRPRTPMISWQDDRLTEPVGGSASTRLDELVAAVPRGRRQAAGVARRPGFGGGNLAVCLSELDCSSVDEPWILHTLGSYVIGALGGPHATHLSSAAALGLVDLDRADWSPELIEAYGLSGLVMPRIVVDVEPVGVVSLVDYEVEVFPDVGDHQASVVGGGDLAADDVAISLGTAGIAARWSPHRWDSERVDSRPYPGGGYLVALSRLPGGRLAEDMAGLIARIASLSPEVNVAPADVWQRALALVGKHRPAERVRVTEQPRLGGGNVLAVTGVDGGDDVVTELLNALMDYYIAAFQSAIDLLFADGPRPQRIRFNGGLVMRSSWFRENFAAGLGLTAAPLVEGDLALDGLGSLIRRFDARPRSPLDEPT